MSMASRSTCIALLALFALATYTSAASDAEPPLWGSSSTRKLAQWYGRRGYGGGWGTGTAQLARNNAAIVNTQYAIRNAVESGASLPATAGAAYYGNEQAYLATQRWYPYGGWWGRR